MDIFSNIDLVNKALVATMMRNNAISENISNVDTPGYKRKDVQFESILEKALTNKSIEELKLDDIQPKEYIQNYNTAYRMDGNNVDIDVEMSEQAKVSAKYSALIMRVNAQIGRFSTVLQNLK